MARRHARLKEWLKASKEEGKGAACPQRSRKWAGTRELVLEESRADA